MFQDLVLCLRLRYQQPVLQCGQDTAACHHSAAPQLLMPRGQVADFGARLQRSLGSWAKSKPAISPVAAGKGRPPAAQTCLGEIG